MSDLRLCLCLHNHQPVGNFDNVIEDAYQDSYLPFLDVFEEYEHLNISLHTSGPLIEWLDRQHPDYIDRIATLVRNGRIEIIGGPFYEPILTMIPSRDRIGQIRAYSQWLDDRIGASVRGMWTPERVWEQSLTSELADNGIEFTVLDDYHFQRAGIPAENLNGYFVTEDQGQTLKVFPGSEQLRYLIPFAQPEQTIEMLRARSQQQPGSVVVFGDDGEKFGTWPDTKKHVYEEGWLRSFFDALTKNRDWLRTCTLAEAAAETRPVGTVSLPDCSYREMTQWSLPVAQQEKLEDISHSFQDDPRWGNITQLIHGASWRNFKLKYPETSEMYARMIGVSRQLQQCESKTDLFDDVATDELKLARLDLYRGQCNCSYWHGAFGGVYLPHLRNAIWHHLLAAENRLNELSNNTGPRVASEVTDFNFDGEREVRLENESLVAWIAPHRGGQLYELDIRDIKHNLLATITRRAESYHEKIRQVSDEGSEAGSVEAASIHERVICKQEQLDQHLQYDALKRNSLIDHFLERETELAEVASGSPRELGDFASGRYSAKILKKHNRIQTRLQRVGKVDGIELKITKGVTLTSGQNAIEIAYLIEGLPQNRELHFAVEFNFAGLPADADDRYFRHGDQQLGHLGTQNDLRSVRELNIVDQWLDIDIGLSANRATNIWTYPVETVSQSEAGFELVHQAISLQPHWLIRGNTAGQWNVTLNLNFQRVSLRNESPKPPCETTTNVLSS